MEKWVYTNDDFYDLLLMLQSENPINEDIIFVIRQATETLTITEKEENLTPLTPLEKEKLFFIVLLLLQANEIIRWQGQDSKSLDSNIRDIIKVATELTKLLTDLFRNKSSTPHQLNYIFNLSNQLQECNDIELQTNQPFQNFEKVKNITRQKFGGIVIETVPLSPLLSDSSSSNSDKLNISNIPYFNPDETSSPSHLNNGFNDKLNKTFTIDKTIPRQEIDQLNRTFTIDKTSRRQKIDRLNRTFNTDERNPRPGIFEQLNKTFTIDKITPPQEHSDILGSQRGGIDGDTVDPWYNAEVTNELNIELERVLSEKHNKETTNIIKNIQKRICESDIPNFSKREIDDLVKRLRQEMNSAVARDQEQASTSFNYSNIENRNIQTNNNRDLKFTKYNKSKKDKEISDSDVVDHRYNTDRANELISILQEVKSEKHNKETTDIIENIESQLFKKEVTKLSKKREIDDLYKRLKQELESALARERASKSSKSRVETDYKSKFDILARLKNKRSPDGDKLDSRYNIARARELIKVLEKEFFENHNEETITTAKDIKKTLTNLNNEITKLKKQQMDALIRSSVQKLESALVKEQEKNFRRPNSNTENSNLKLNRASKFKIVNKVKLPNRQDIIKLGTNLKTSLANLSNNKTSISHQLDDISKVTNEIQEYVDRVQQVAPPKKTGNTTKKIGDDVTNIGQCEVCGCEMYLVEFTGEEPQGNYRIHPHHRGTCSKNKVNNESEEINDLKIKFDMEIKKYIILHDTMTNLLKDQNSLINKLCNENKQSGKELKQNKAQIDDNECLKMFKDIIKLLEDFVNEYKKKNYLK